MGRSINFEGNSGESDEVRNKSRGFTANDAENYRNIHESRQNNRYVDLLHNKNNINFSSEGESSSEDEHQRRNNFRRNGKSKFIIINYFRFMG